MKLEREHKILIIRSIGSLLLTALAFFVQSSFRIENALLIFTLYLPPYLLIGFDIVFKAIKNIIHGEKFDECFLMTLATIGAFCIGEFPEAVAVMLFYQIGEMFQDIAVDNSKRSIRALIDLKPEQATVLRNGKEIIVAPETIQIDEQIVVKPGERIALDGVIVSGSSTLNTSVLTGESMPVKASEGDSVLSGSLNISSRIVIRVIKTYSNSTVAKIIELTETAQSRKAKVDSFIKRFARYYTPCVVIIALLLAFIPPLFFNALWSEWINRSLVFLVVSCPCALVISVPLSFFSGMGAMAKKGILIKGASAIEQLASAKTFVFDKTGTITEGTFKVSNINAIGLTKEELLEIAAYAEYYSDHPIAKSIKSAYCNDIEYSRIHKAEEIAGMGISAIVDGKKVLAGNDKLVADSALSEKTKSFGTRVYISVDDEYKGYIEISDTIKKTSIHALRELKKCGITKNVMITGDNENVAQHVADAIGIDVVYASALPAEKAQHIENLIANEKGKTVFVGDGINDAPALATADVGIAMGTSGSDIAIDTADAVIMNDNLLKAAESLKMAKKTVAIAKQNIWISLLVKAFVLITGAFGISGMWLAVFADVGVTVIAVLNATRMLYTKAKKDC